jgi:predicted PhzF superfamily epimerase YddE/YHI9
MQISKDQIIDFLRQQGQHDQAEQAQQQLPDQVDTDQHADLLSRFNIDPKQLLGKLGGLGGALGNL